MLNDEKEISDSIDTGSAPTPYEAEERRQEEAMDEDLSESIAEDEAKIEAAEQSGASPAEVHTLKKKAVNSVFWRIGEVGGRQIIQLGISIVLARLILPESFGAVAMLSIFIAIANVFVDSGFSTAIIRKTDRTEADCSTVFWFNIVIAIFFYGILFLCAPLIADFYEMPILIPVLRVTALSIVINSLAGLQRSLLTADMQFKALAKFSIISLIISGTVGMIMAYYDFQVWALVAQTLVAAVINTIFLWWRSPWHPSLIFSTASFKEFFGFGSKLLASGLLDMIYGNIYSVIIGKVYKAADLAYYNRAISLAILTSTNPSTILQSVVYPTLCKLQDSDDALRNGYRRILRIAAFIIFPLCLGMGAVAYPLINTFYTEKWIFAAPLLQIMVFEMMWYPIHAINLNLLMVKGRSDLFFRLEIIKKIFGIIMLCITVPIGLEAMCYGGICTSIIALVINTYYTGKLLNLGFFVQLRDFWPSLLLSGIMFICLSLLSNILGNNFLSLIICVSVGIAFYLGSAIILHRPELQELRQIRK